MPRCPSPEQLRELLADRLNGPDAEAVEAHLESCLVCQQVLERLTDRVDARKDRPVARVEAAQAGADFLCRLEQEPPTGAGLSPVLAGDASAATVSPSNRDGAEGPAGLPAVPGYEILGELGRGGMGMVYQARQLPLQRLVALKMILAGGYAGEADVARFRAETEAIASLDHPHIVPVYEVGEWRAGGVNPPVHYFSMKLIDGGSLKEQLPRLTHDPRAAVALLAQVARAIHHAHQRGLLHRDLKPANILIDKDGQPYVTDFGLARRVEGGSGLTQTGAIVGTPSYMAPEQAGGKKDLTTAVDVYALGAILYELFTGRPPFQGETPLDIVLQVLEREPEPPHTVNPQVNRDLELISLKCLAKDPQRRYGSAAALAEDLRRFHAGEPITARPAGTLERTWRWCRRKPAVASLTFTLLLSVVAGLAAVTGLWLHAQRQRDRAEANFELARANFALARQAVEKTITQVAEDRRLKQADFHQLRRDLLASAVPFYEEFVRQPGADAQVEAERGRAYLRLGFVRREMRETEQAVEAYEQSRASFARLAADFPAVPDYGQELARSHNNLGNLLRELGKPVEAEAACRAALGIQERLAADFPAVPDYCQLLAASHYNLGFLLKDLGKPAEAEAAFRAAITLQDRLAADFPTVPDYRQELARSHNNLGNLLRDLGKRAESEAAYRAALGLQERLVADFPVVPGYREELALSHKNLGNLLRELGKRVEAEAAGRAALRIQERLAADFPAVPDYRQLLAGSHGNLGNLLRELGKRVEAEAAYRAALSIQERLVADFPAVREYRNHLATGHINVGILLKDLGRWVEAEAAYRAGLSIRERLVADFPAVLDYAVELGNGYKIFGNWVRDGGQPQGSLDWYTKAITTLEPVLRTEPRLVRARYFLHQAQLGRAMALAQLGNHAQAVAEADDLAQAKDVTAGIVYDVACVYALASAAAGKDAALSQTERDRLAERRAARAVELLAKVQAAGYFKNPRKIEDLKQDPDLGSLRTRADFQKLQQQVEAKEVPREK